MTDSHPIAILFAGQGAQEVGMGKDLAAEFPGVAGLFAQADEVLGFELSRVMFEGPAEELTRTSRCQPALYVHGLACFRLLNELMPEATIAAAAGLSLGELTAHAAAGSFSFEDGLRLVAQRGQFMEDACEDSGGSMAAMLGSDEESVRQLAAECDVDVANFNAPGQIVVSGSKEGIAAAIEKCRDFGIRRARELDVAGAYHSRLMSSAEEKLADALEGVDLHAPAFPVVCNVEAREVGNAQDIRATLAAQVTGSVRWEESMRLLLDRGVSEFVELGPGRILAGLLRKTERSASVRSLATAEDFHSLAAPVSAE